MNTDTSHKTDELKQPYGVLRATRGEPAIFMYNQPMHFNVRPFRRLQWQLSLSYTLVAVGSLLVVELILIAGFLFLLNSDTLPHLLARAFREQFSVALRSYLDRPQPDLKGIDRYLSAYIDPNNERSNDVGLNSGSGQIWTTRDSTQSLIVLDTQSRVLWTQFPLEGLSVGDRFDLARIPGLDKVMPAALANDRNEDHLYTYQGSLMVMAIPIESEETATSPARVLGVMVFQLSMPSMTNPAFVLQLLPTVLISALLFTFFAGLVGTLFGFFTARGLTLRLGRVSKAADAWSRGDFSSFIADAHDDELSELSHRLNAMAEQLQNLMETRQALATVEERNRIARELHDSVKQQVFAASMQLGAAHALLPDEDSPAAQRLTEAEQLTRQAQNELTALIRELRPVALESKGLVRALRDLSADWSRQAGIAAQFDGPAGPNDPLPLIKEQTLYRVAQEALANVARHSAARSVRITYRRTDAEVQLTIQDDGQGFDPTNASQEQGVGLKSMRERVQAVDGSLEIDSLPGRGTLLTVRLPIRETQSAARQAPQVAAQFANVEHPLKEEHHD